MYHTSPSTSLGMPSPKRRRIDICRTHLASLVSNEDFILADDPSSRFFGPNFRAPRTVFDDFAPAFAVDEFLAKPDTSAAFLSEVFFALELAVVACFPGYTIVRIKSVKWQWNRDHTHSGTELLSSTGLWKRKPRPRV